MTRINPERLFLLEHIRFDKKIVRAKGHYLYDSDGRSYLDFLAQYGAVPLGHNPTALWDAVRALGINEAPSLVQPFISPAAEELAEALIAASPIESGYVTFANSGAETVEVAIKLARARTNRKTILSTLNGFHGKTLGAVSATGNSIYREPFLVDAPHFEHIPYGDLDALAQRLEAKDVAAFIVEPIQGEAGMITPPQGYMAAAAGMCRRTRTLFVLDEIQTGLGRTGRLFAAEHDNVSPDVLLLAKALGGGLVSLGACLCSEDAWTSQFGNYHSSTFANNHFTCSIGLATLGLLQQRDQELVRHADSMGLHLRQGLERLVSKYGDVFSSVDGKGLMQGLTLAPWDRHDSYFLTHASDTGFAVPLVCGHLLHEHGILTAPTFNGNNVLRLEPPLTIETEEVEQLLSALESTAQMISAGDFVKFFEYVTGTPKRDGAVALTPAAKSVKPSAEILAPVRAISTAMDGGTRCLGKFAFLIHYTEMDDLVLTGPPGFAHLDSALKERWTEWMRSWSARRFDAGVACHVPAIHSKKGGYAEGWLIAAPLMPRQMLRLPLRDREVLIKAYVDTAKRLEVDMLGLGAFTSIITRNGADIADCGLHVTTGNSLTAAASAESLKSVIRSQGRDIAKIETGVIGAAGSVGRLVCKMLARECGRLTLFGNPQNPGAQQKLQMLAGELYRDALQGDSEGRLGPLGQALAAAVGGRHAVPEDLAGSDDPEAFLALYRHVEAAFEAAHNTGSPIRITVDLSTYLPYMEAVVSATNQGNAFIDVSLLRPGAVICDVARPPDFSKSLAGRRPDVFVYEGGLVRFPGEVTFGSRNIIGTPAGINLACLAETVVLTMAGIRRNYSMAERPPLGDAEEIFRQATAHGFSVAPPAIPKRANWPKTEHPPQQRDTASRALSL
jgi:acetylornithine/succinyldiaminopimelate/putrescine aminotransferase/predicted amino acid dehydrogenase